jgi:HTH-type transcriptional regulator/antitoxin HipB
MKLTILTINKMEKNEAIKNTKNFDELLDIQYGKIGTGVRDEFEKKCAIFCNKRIIKRSKT